MSMSYDGGQLFIGDLNGYLHVIDPTNGAFELLHVGIFLETYAY